MLQNQGAPEAQCGPEGWQKVEEEEGARREGEVTPHGMPPRVG